MQLINKIDKININALNLNVYNEMKELKTIILLLPSMGSPKLSIYFFEFVSKEN